jgi:hypothetical protein
VFQAISPVAKVVRSVADALSATLPAMSAVPAPTGSARPRRGPSAPAPITPSSPAPSAAANTAPTVTSLRCACVRPIRSLTPHSEFWTRDQHSMAAARTSPERRWGSRAVCRAVVRAVVPRAGRRPVSGHTARAVSAMAASGPPCPKSRCGTVR